MKQLMDGKLWPKLWTALAQVLDVSSRSTQQRKLSSPKASSFSSTDWRMLSPSGLNQALRLIHKLAKRVRQNMFIEN